jgi:hypothetical protein
MYGWSKYGGARHGLVKEELDEWFCQACRQKQVKELPNYMFDYDGDMRDFIRICSKCRNTAIKERIRKVVDLFKKVRKIFVEDTWI